MVSQAPSPGLRSGKSPYPVTVRVVLAAKRAGVMVTLPSRRSAAVKKRIRFEYMIFQLLMVE
jgi:hypothetical protein